MKRYINGKLTEVSEISAPDGYVYTDGEVFVKTIPGDWEGLFTLCPEALCQETEQKY